MVGVSPKNQAKDRVFVCHSIFQTLQNNGADALAAAIAVCRIVEGLTVASSREEIASIQSSRKVGVRQDVGTAGNSGINVPGPQRVARNMDRSKARRTGSINGIARTTEFVKVVNPAGDECPVAARNEASAADVSDDPCHNKRDATY